MEIDHVVLAARSRADAEQVLNQAGLGIARGRTIPGLGLSNLVVPLGQGLLEIHYPNGEPPAPGAPPLLELDRKALAAHPSEPLVPMAWLVLIEDASRLRDLAAANDAPVSEAPSEGPGFPPYTLAGLPRPSAGPGCPRSSTGRRASPPSAPHTDASPVASPASTWPARPATFNAGAADSPASCTPCRAPLARCGSRSASSTGAPSRWASPAHDVLPSRRFTAVAPSQGASRSPGAGGSDRGGVHVRQPDPCPLCATAERIH
ncbi:VOC family protein [Streptomyces sp. URMC 128]